MWASSEASPATGRAPTGASDHGRVLGAVGVAWEAAQSRGDSTGLSSGRRLGERQRGHREEGPYIAQGVHDVCGKDSISKLYRKRDKNQF
jgi:hypothetical protein